MALKVNRCRRNVRRACSTRACVVGKIKLEVLAKSERTKLDNGPDNDFYSFPRIVKHASDGFLEKVTALYRQRIPKEGRVLDLCSSWISHLPNDIQYREVVGHGMNASELLKNERLDHFFVRNLNDDPGLECKDRSFDAVLICCSVQYLEAPEQIFSEICRVLKPGGVLIVTFTNRLFYSKAISAWRDGSGYSRSRLVAQYIDAIEGFTVPEVLNSVEKEGEEKWEDKGGDSFFDGARRSVEQFLWKIIRASEEDPFYAVVTYRNFKREE